jgi:predicted RNA-binding Zn ribbon-like protein
MTDPAFFIAETRGIDFLNSVASPAGVPIDWIEDGAGLIDWLGQAGLAPAEDLRALAARATPGELDRVAGQARDLRDWFRGFVSAHAGRGLGADAIGEVAPVNRLLERDEAYWQIVPHSGEADHRHLALRTARRWRSPEALLIPIAEAIARVVVEEDFTRLKACEGHGCTLMFMDRTRTRARRWCSMGACGNRAKVAAHRQRKRGG